MSIQEEDKELTDLVAITEVIEGMTDEEYVSSLKSLKDCEDALADLQGLSKVALKIVAEVMGDKKEQDRYKVYTRYSRCIQREISLVIAHSAKFIQAGEK